MFQAKVDEGGKCLQVSREENVCEYLWVLLVNSVFDPATRSESYLIYVLFCTKDRFYDFQKIKEPLLWENIWSNTFIPRCVCVVFASPKVVVLMSECL